MSQTPTADPQAMPAPDDISFYFPTPVGSPAPPALVVEEGAETTGSDTLTEDKPGLLKDAGGSYVSPRTHGSSQSASPADLAAPRGLGNASDLQALLGASFNLDGNDSDDESLDGSNDGDNDADSAYLKPPKMPLPGRGLSSASGSNSVAKIAMQAPRRYKPSLDIAALLAGASDGADTDSDLPDISGFSLSGSGPTVTLGDFEPSTFVNTGSFGTVVKAVYKPSKKTVAIKVIQKRAILCVGHNPDRVVQESKLLCRFQDTPFFANFLCTLVTPIAVYMVMDYYPSDFQQLYGRDGLSVDATRFYSAELLLAIESLHKHGICHRDLKPENMLLDKDNHLVVSDFGLCEKDVDLKPVSRGIFGTLSYMAPEFLDEEAYDLTCDIWSFGIIVSEMQSGKAPFDRGASGRSFDETTTKEAIKTGTPRWGATMSGPLKELLTRCLDRNPKARPQMDSGMYPTIRQHRYYGSIDWEKLAKREIAAPKMHTAGKSPRPATRKSAQEPVKSLADDSIFRADVDKRFIAVEKLAREYDVACQAADAAANAAAAAAAAVPVTDGSDLDAPTDSSTTVLADSSTVGAAASTSTPAVSPIRPEPDWEVEMYYQGLQKLHPLDPFLGAQYLPPKDVLMQK